MNTKLSENVTEIKNYNLKNRIILIAVLSFGSFIAGLITILNDLLIPHLKEAFKLNYFQASLVQFFFFGAYFAVSPFVGFFMEKVGYRIGYKLCWLICSVFMVLACLLFIPASQFLSYPMFLIAVFILASSMTAGGVITTPLALFLAKNGKEAQTLVVVNVFNSLGTTIAPSFGALFMLSDEALKNLSGVELAKSVQTPYIIIAGLAVITILYLPFLKIPDMRELAKAKAPDVKQQEHRDIWEYKYFILGAIALFCYVGAEASIGSNLVSLMEKTLGFDRETASHYLTFYWGGALVGRFIGVFLLVKILPQRLLAFNAIINTLLCSGAIFGGIIGDGWLTISLLLSMGLFNSVMFPSIFALATKDLGLLTSRASGILFSMILGGAIITPIQGLIADHFSLLVSFIIPAICYIYIAFFGIKGHKIQ